MAPCRQAEGGTIARITFERPPEQVERLDDPVLFPRFGTWQGSQKEIVGGEVVRRPLGRTADLGGLQFGFDDPGDADRDLVL